MRYYKQSQGFSCGPACARMMLHALGIEVSEEKLIEIMGASSNHGTPRENWNRLADAYNVELMTKEYGSLEELEELQTKGWQIAVLILADVPHYVSFLEVRDGRVHMHDPWDTPHYSLLIRNFLKKWEITPDKWHHDSIYLSHHWFAAIRKLPE